MATNERNDFQASLYSDCLDCFEYFCQPCRRDGKSLRAEGYCKNCDEFLCVSCYGVHTKPSVLRHHDLVGEEEMKTLEPPVWDNSMEKCPEHNQDQEFFCTDHKIMACRTCKKEKHQICGSVVKLQAGLVDSSEYKNIRQALSNMEKTLQQADITLQGQKAQTDETYNKFVEDVRVFKEEIILLINDVEKGLVQRAENVQRKDRERIELNAERITSMSHEVQSLQSELQCLESRKQMFGLFLKMKKAEETLKEVQTRFDNLDRANDTTQYRFLPNVPIKDVLSESAGLGKLSGVDASEETPKECSSTRYPPLVHLSSISSDSTCNSLSDISEDFDAEEQPTASDDISEEKLEVTQLEDIYIDSQFSKHASWTTGSAIVGGNKLAVTDYNIKRVSVVDLNSNAILEMRWKKHGPWDVVEIVQDEHAGIYSASSKQDIIPKPASKREDTLPCASQPEGSTNKNKTSKYRDTLPIGHSQHQDFAYGTQQHEDRIRPKTTLAIGEEASSNRQHRQTDSKYHHIKHEIAVTLPDKQQIAILKVGSKITIHKKIQVIGECYGLAYNQSRLLVTYKNPAKVEIMDTHGKPLKKIEVDETGQRLFRFPAYIASNQSGEMMYISDKENNSVIRIRMDGSVEKAIKNDKLECPLKLTVDENGNIFVCGKDSKNVVVMDASMTRIRELVSIETSPHSLCYRHDTGRLYVGLFGNNKISVYQLSRY